MTSYYYPYRGWARLSHEARLRKRQLHVSKSKYRQPLPWHRFSFIMAIVLWITVVPLFLLLWVFEAAAGRASTLFLFYIAVMAECTAYIGATSLHSWAMHYYPRTLKACVGMSGDFTISGHVPGMFIDHVELRASSKADAPKEKVAVEYIPFGRIDSVPDSVARIRGIIIARAVITEKKGKWQRLQAGVLHGRRYIIDAVPHYFVAGDVETWHAVNWRERVTAKLPKEVAEELHDYSIFIIALDRYDPVTQEAPAEAPGLLQSIYTERRRNKQLSARIADITEEDKEQAEAEEEILAG